MSALFSALIEAATGQAEVALPRPGARFGAAANPSDGIEWRDDVGLVQGPRQASAGAAELAQTAKPFSDRVHPPGSEAPSRLRQMDRLLSAPAAPVLAPETPHILRKSANPALQDAGQDAQPAPRPMANPENPSLLPQAEPSEAVMPLMPLASPAAEVRGRDGDRAVERESPKPGGPTLTIGRIEVRQPAAPASAAPRQAQTVNTRPVVLPRASVRQTLDDYRAGRRR